MNPISSVSNANSSAPDRFTIDGLPDELVGHILLKSRVGYLELMSTAGTCQRFLAFTQPVLTECKTLSTQLLKLHPNQSWEMFEKLPGLQGMLAGIALKQVLNQRARIENPILNSTQLHALHHGFQVNGLRRLSLCVDIAPTASMQLALACLPASGESASFRAFGKLLSALALALEAAQDDQTRYDLVCLIKTVYCVVPAEINAYKNAHLALRDFQDPKIQIDALSALLGITEKTGLHVNITQAEVATCVMEVLGKRISDGKLFVHPEHNQIIQMCISYHLPRLSAGQTGQWLTQAVDVNLCSAISQYRVSGPWRKTPWPLLLVAASYACADPELEREVLAKRIGTALESGGWQLVTSLAFSSLNDRLRFAANPGRGLAEWMSDNRQEDSESEDEVCTIC